MRASHVARHRDAAEDQIAAMDSDDQKLVIDWSDGHRSTFHLVWLRDNCSCEKCGDHSGGQRFFELNMMPEHLANDVSLADGLVRIFWQADGHVTSYDPAWLRAHCYADSERSKRRHRPVTWDATLTGDVPAVDYLKAQDDAEERLKLYDSVRTYGICLVRNVSSRVEATEELAGFIGYARETHYGRVFEIISTPHPTLIANQPVALRPHTDEPFRTPPPGIMIFHTIRASEDGGGASVMTDGFKLAEDLKVHNPEHFELLTNVPIAHRRFIEGVGLREEAPVIRLNYAGDVCEFRMNERTMGPIDLPGDLIEPVYAALTKLYEMAYDGRYHMHHLLEDGDALVFDNARVMHARTGFNGNRHVRLMHVGSDEFYSRWRQLRHDIHGDINPV